MSKRKEIPVRSGSKATLAIVDGSGGSSILWIGPRGKSGFYVTGKVTLRKIMVALAEALGPEKPARRRGGEARKEGEKR